MEFSRRALDKIFKRRDRYDIPEWQRDEVWSDEKKRLLLDTILRGWKLPKFYFLKTSASPEEFDVVDGQQRLMTIFEFMDNSLELSAATAEEFGGATYQDLPDSVSDAFDDYEIEFDAVTDAEDDEIKDFFQRLQQGMQLTSSEKLNSVNSKLTDYCRKLAKHPFFAGKVSITDKRKAHFDIVTKVAAVDLDGLDTSLRFDDLKATFIANENFSSSSSVAKRLRATFDFLDQVFPGKSPILRNRATIQSFATIATQFVQAKRTEASAKPLRAFFEHFAKELSKQVELGQAATDADYLAFQRTLSANMKSGAQTRNEILLRKLFAHNPSLGQALGPQAVVKSGIASEIERRGEAVAGLVEQVNEVYAATNGGDLVKLTNKTAAALTRLGQPISDQPTYEAFIKDLYFLFREGVGTRLSDTPDAFVDINLLRTGLEHDVDHGKAGEIAKKKKAIGEAFKRYSGAASPSTLGPDFFPVVQSKLLSATANALEGILADLG